MRVAIGVEQLLSPVPGGTGRYTAELAAGLVRTRDAGDEVTTWSAWHRDLAAAEVAGIGRPRRLPLPRRALAQAWQYGLGPCPRRADIVHAPTLLAPPRRDQETRAVVVTIHDAVPWTHPQTLTPRGVRWHKAMAERAVATGAVITTPTQVVADDLLAHLPGLSANRVTVLGAGVAPVLRREPAPSVVEEIVSRLGLPETFVLSLATLEPRKGLDVAIEAYQLLGADAPPLVIAGQPGWGGVEPDALAREHGVLDKVHVLGRLSDLDLAVVLRRAIVLIMPSRAEGFGLPVAEALAVGTPVICSDLPALAEVAAGAAVLVPPGEPAALADALTELLGNDAERTRLIKVGLARSSAFDWDAVATRAWQLYRRLD
jgi:glycosyltransferase involved in cell wall biosynthesis